MHEIQQTTGLIMPFLTPKITSNFSKRGNLQKHLPVETSDSHRGKYQNYGLAECDVI
jgi:hypothetical protein